MYIDLDDYDWFCEYCGAYLNIQEDFDADCGLCECAECGCLNNIDEDCIVEEDDELTIEEIGEMIDDE